MQSNKETSSTFADKIGIKRSNLSHVLSGRNKPSLDFLEKIINFYPNVNASWLVTGKTRSGEFEEEVTNVTTTSKMNIEADVETVLDDKKTVGLKKSTNERSIQKVIVFYSNGEIEEFNHTNQ